VAAVFNEWIDYTEYLLSDIRGNFKSAAYAYRPFKQNIIKFKKPKFRHQPRARLFEATLPPSPNTYGFRVWPAAETTILAIRRTPLFDQGSEGAQAHCCWSLAGSQEAPRSDCSERIGFGGTSSQTGSRECRIAERPEAW